MLPAVHPPAWRHGVYSFTGHSIQYVLSYNLPKNGTKKASEIYAVVSTDTEYRNFTITAYSTIENTA